MKAQVLC